MNNVLALSKSDAGASMPKSKADAEMKESSDYIQALMNLRQDAIPGRWPAETNRVAPHKPLLLVSVFDEFIDNPCKPNLIEPTLQLETRFDSYWEKVIRPSHETTMALPFFHLRTDGFWHLIALPGKEAVLSAPVQVKKSTTALRDIVRGACFDDRLHALLADCGWVHHLRSVVITRHFAPELHHYFF